ncbi:MAG: hypothetical protein ACRC5M_04875 [Anaeroplasmataceae bacterium]
MKHFFEWLNTPGFMEETTMIVIFIIVVGLIIVLLKSGTLDLKSMKYTPNDKKSNSTIVVKGSNINPNVSQDYKLLNLIVRNHMNHILDEMREYCIENGLGEKSRDEYSVYVDDRKRLFVRKLISEFDKEYTSYNDISLSVVHDTINEIEEKIMIILEKLYTKIRDISIKKHEELSKERERIFEKYRGKFIYVLEASGGECDSNTKKRLEEILLDFEDLCKNLSIKERNDILDNQINKIKMVKDELTYLITSTFMEKMKSTS